MERSCNTALAFPGPPLCYRGGHTSPLPPAAYEATCSLMLAPRSQVKEVALSQCQVKKDALQVLPLISWHTEFKWSLPINVAISVLAMSPLFFLSHPVAMCDTCFPRVVISLSFVFSLLPLASQLLPISFLFLCDLLFTKSSIHPSIHSLIHSFIQQIFNTRICFHCL